MRMTFKYSCIVTTFYCLLLNTKNQMFRSEVYGKEMVAHLSKILNECSNENGALASALAIEGITILCQHEIIDIGTTWHSLEPIVEHERRPIVIQR